MSPESEVEWQTLDFPGVVAADMPWVSGKHRDRGHFFNKALTQAFNRTITLTQGPPSPYDGSATPRSSSEEGSVGPSTGSPSSQKSAAAEESKRNVLFANDLVPMPPLSDDVSSPGGLVLSGDIKR
jgi:hypothetical protein